MASQGPAATARLAVARAAISQPAAGSTTQPAARPVATGLPIRTPLPPVSAGEPAAETSQPPIRHIPRRAAEETAARARIVAERARLSRETPAARQRGRRTAASLARTAARRAKSARKRHEKSGWELEDAAARTVLGLPRQQTEAEARAQGRRERMTVRRLGSATVPMDTDTDIPPPKVTGIALGSSKIGCTCAETQKGSGGSQKRTGRQEGVSVV